MHGFSFKIRERKADRTYDVGGKELLTVRCRSQSERDNEKLNGEISLIDWVVDYILCVHK